MAYLLARPQMVAAAMLHAAYESGNFGYCYGGPTRRNRERVRGAVGDAVEEIVCRYWKTTWNAKQVSQVAGRANALSSEDKDVVVLRLANSLEDHLDLAMCYCAQSRREYDGTLQELRELAQSLGLHELGESFASISNEMDEPARDQPNVFLPARPKGHYRRERCDLPSPATAVVALLDRTDALRHLTLLTGQCLLRSRVSTTEHGMGRAQLAAGSNAARQLSDPSADSGSSNC